MSDIVKLTSKISDNIQLFVNALQKENPKKGFFLLRYEPKLMWVVRWESPKYLKAYCELEIWVVKNKYSIMASYSTESIVEIEKEEFLLYEDRTEKNLIESIDEILHEFRKGVIEFSGLA